MTDPQSPSDRPGTALPGRFGPYRVETVIGAGGMGMVYRAFDEALNRPVALKTLLPSLAADPEFVGRFTREAQAAAALNHPNIMQIYSIGQEGTLPFFAMEMIDGPSLEALMRQQGTIDPMTALDYIMQAARGLQHAARKNLIHRDIKPSNLMLTAEGVVKVTDFGLAKAARSEVQLTMTGQVLGSPGYISPEQAQGETIDQRTDIYSLGATFYHLVTGRLPFDGPTSVAIIVKHLNEPLRSPRLVNPAVPYPLAAAIQRMMAKRPAERFQDYDQLLRELDRVAIAVRDAANRTDVSAGSPAAVRASRPGSRVRPAAPAPALQVPERSASRLPLALAIMLGLLVVLGLVQHRRTAREDALDEARPGTAQSLIAGGSPSSTVLTAQGSLTGAATGSPGDWSVSSDARVRRRFREKSRASLTITDNDHEILPDGRLRVFGQVRNTGGGVAGRGRVRITILGDSGQVVAHGESPLSPPTIPPTMLSEFELVLDYRGPVQSIQAELAWFE